MCISQQWLRGGDIRIHVEKRMTQTSVDTVCEQLAVPETDPGYRRLVHTSLCRERIASLEGSTLAESADGQWRSSAPSTRGPSCLLGDEPERQVGKRPVAGPGTGASAACRHRPRLPVNRTVRRRAISPGTRTPEPTMTHTRHRRPDQPSSLSRPHQILMATDTPAGPSDCTVSDCDHAPLVREGPR